jgi:hypothetical protein
MSAPRQILSDSGDEPVMTTFAYTGDDGSVVTGTVAVRLHATSGLCIAWGTVSY